MDEEMVSIITPLYKCENFIEETIKCVIGQTYKKWEMLLIDDCTPDNSSEIVKKYSQIDNRIKYFKLDENSGAAIARNRGLKEAKGRFIAYLDADDLWKKDKLEKQIKFMIENNYAFTCTDYEKINEEGNSLNKIVRIPRKVNYNLFLRNTIIQTVGVIVDTKKTGKELLVMPNIRRRQDAATWCQLLKSGYDCYEVPENLSYYRVVNNSLSSNNAFNAVKKRIYI